MTVEELLPGIAADGYLVNNLFQRDAELWQANLRRGDACAAFAMGYSPAEALQAAWERMRREHPPTPKKDFFA